MIKVNLSLHEDVKLNESDNAWVPQSLKDFGPKTTAEDDEQILKRIRGILNKLTPENFDKLLQSASKFPMDNVERINKVMLLIFEKTVSEPNFAPTYARFCKFLFNPEDSNHNMFKGSLIRRIQNEFDSNVNNAKAKEAKLKPLMEKMAAATDPKEKLEIKAELDDQEYQFRRRAWGTVRFIGEMCKMDFINIDRVCICVETLFDARCEEKLEYLCKLLSTVGPQLDNASSTIRQRLDAVCAKMRQVVMDKRNQAGQKKISSRVRFMMQDILDLRARRWDQKESTPAAAVVASREVSPAMSSSTRASSASSSSQHNQQSQQQQQHQNRGISRNLMTWGSGLGSGSGSMYDKKRQQNYEPQQQKPTAIDHNKLSFNLLQFNDDITLGNSSPLMRQASKPINQTLLSAAKSAASSSKPAAIAQTKPAPPPQPIEQQQQDLSTDECECLVNGLIQLVVEEESPAKWKSIPTSHQVSIINYILTDYLHSSKLKRHEIDLCSQLFLSLFKDKLLAPTTFKEAYEKFSETWDDILVNDIPKGWENIFKFLGPMLHNEYVAIDAIWDKQWFDSTCGDRFLQSMIVYFTSQFGANYMRSLWDYYNLRWDMFLHENRIPSFIASNNFEFIDNHKIIAPMFVQRNTDDLVKRIKQLLAQSGDDVDLIIDFITTNVRIDSDFVRSLTMFLCDYSVIYSPNKNLNSCNSTKSKSKQTNDLTSSSTYKLRDQIFTKKCIPLLFLCIDSNDERELSCLNAIVTRCNMLGCDKFPTDLISSIMAELYGTVISKESFKKWREQLANQKTEKEDFSKELESFFKTLPI